MFDRYSGDCDVSLVLVSEDKARQQGIRGSFVIAPYKVAIVETKMVTESCMSPCLVGYFATERPPF